MSISLENLFGNLPSSSSTEFLEVLAENRFVRIERIVSNGQRSPAGFWYDQEENEWVVVLSGEATLEFADGQIVEMSRGDHLLIRAHIKHRVRSTTTEEPTVWLAVFFGNDTTD